MEWTQFAIFFIGVMGLFIWNRTESRNDQRHTEEKLESIRALTYEVIKEGQEFRQMMAQESKDFHARMSQESKDFHGRLCAIEERNRNKKGE